MGKNSEKIKVASVENEKGESLSSFFLNCSPLIVPDSGQPTNITHLVKKRKKSESDADAGSAVNGDAAKKPHVEVVPANGNCHSNGN